MGALRLYKPDPTRTVMLWNATGNHQNIWLQANVDVRSSTWFQVRQLLLFSSSYNITYVALFHFYHQKYLYFYHQNLHLVNLFF